MAVFDNHHPWTFAFGILGNLVSVLVYLAPLPTFIRIYKEKSTMGFDCLPYLVALFSSMLWLYYAFIKTNAVLLISINSFGCIIETIYISLFLYYAATRVKTRTIKLLGLINVGLFSLIFFLTFFVFGGLIRTQIVGWICVAFSICVFVAPLSIVFQVVRTKSVEFMPFTLSFFLTLSAVMWFSYGLFLRDICIALPNVLGFFLGMIQMVLYGMYRNANPRVPEIEQDKKKGEQVNINIMVIGKPEVDQDEDSMKCGDKKIKEEEIEGANFNIGSGVVPCAINVEPGPLNLQLESPVIVVCAA